MSPEDRLAAFGWAAVVTGGILIPAAVDSLAARRGATSMSRGFVRTLIERPVAGPVVFGALCGAGCGLAWHFAQIAAAELRRP